MQGIKADAAAESEELARFRQQWLEEVRGKKKTQGSQNVVSPPASVATGSVEASDTPHSPLGHRAAHRRASNVSASPPPVTRQLASSTAAVPFGPTLQRAVEVYKKAVQHEQRSELDDALRLYRTAFRMDPNVDRAFHRIEDELQRKAVPPTSPSQHKVQHQKTGSSESTIDSLVQELQGLELGPGRIPVAHARGEGFVTGTLATLVASWPVDVRFEQEDEQEGVPIQNIPDELLMLVLRLLDHTALERFAKVNRKARVLTLDASIWRPMVKTLYQPPQISSDDELDALAVKYMADYRRVYVEHPRVRYDGLYIAVCHYIRNGVGENAWVNYSHLITYHRYLRFYPDGQVLSLLANEGLAPAQVIPMLKPSLRMKGFMIGTWYLEGTEVHIEDMQEPDGTDSRYSFQMILELRSRPLGRWNRLDIRAYDSVHIGSGEATPLALKNERSFWFSKVRSYA
ncbi:hypothetical protein C8Q80DRAFT_1110639 [Daedaleopsis nitida]|nr:hypothetical protein C8Q80DRAFT_1110639 [Daedaleopsis nitida]